MLTVRGVAASYGPRQVLRNVSFDVTAGRCTAVVGQSGSGKTTLARSLVGLHTDWTGDVQLSGTKLSSDPRRRSKEDRRIMQYVFQNPYGSLNPRMTVRENLEEPLRYFFNHSRSERNQKVMRSCRRSHSPPSTASACRNNCPVGSANASQWDGL